MTGLLWKRHEKYFHQFIDLAQNSHYTLKFSNIINAVDYGVPQNRKRVFIFGIHEDLNNSTIKFPPKPTHHSPNSGVEPFGYQHHQSLKIFLAISKNDTSMNTSLVNSISPRRKDIIY